MQKRERRASLEAIANPGDKNSARVVSGAYTREQYADFQRQLAEVEEGGPTAYFAGDPDLLPANVPERQCAECGDTFRSVLTEEKVSCYVCELCRLVS